MKKIVFVTIVIILIVAIGIYIGADKNSAHFKIVKLTGGEAYANFTESDFSWIAGQNEDSISALPMIYGDLLYIFTDEDKMPLYRYKETDGDYLNFHREDFKLYLSDKIIALEITENENFLNWLENINPEEINDLRYIEVSGDVKETALPSLKKLAGIKADIGIFVKEVTPAISDILKLFNPTWLAAPDGEFDDKVRKQISGLNNLELLYIYAGDSYGVSWDINIIQKLKRLQTLILTNLSQPDSGKFITNNNLRSVSIMESEITDISFLSKLTNINELSLSNCNSITSIDVLEKLPNLERLCLTNCANITDIDILYKLKSLKWLSFNPGITEEEIDTLAGLNKNIEVVGLVNCKNIKDVSSFEPLKRLACMSVYNTDIDINSLYGLKRLRYLSLPDSIYSDSLLISQVRDKIPNCIIVPSRGLCLGSGWILLIIPALIILRLGTIFIKKLRS
jgi:hypothetical protein